VTAGAGEDDAGDDMSLLESAYTLLPPYSCALPLVAAELIEGVADDAARANRVGLAVFVACETTRSTRARAEVDDESPVEVIGREAEPGRDKNCPSEVSLQSSMTESLRD
jgi:hypothetical protein